MAQGHRPAVAVATEVQIFDEAKLLPNGAAQLYNYKTLYELCWVEDPSSRPDMSSVKSQISTLQSQKEHNLFTLKLQVNT